MLLLMQRLSKSMLVDCLHGIPSYVRPSYKIRSIRSCSSALVDHIRRRITHLASLSDTKFLDVCLSLHTFDCISDEPRVCLIDKIIRSEYGEHIISFLAMQRQSRADQQKAERKAIRLQSVQNAIAFEKEIKQAWPRVIKEDVVFQCLEDYRLGSVWCPPLVCCVCGLERQNVVDVEINGVDDPPLNFFPLHSTDPFIWDDGQFYYGIDAIDGAILEPLGFKDQTSDGLIMQICPDCHSSLCHDKVPRFALANRLYRGKLPDKFKDLTWIEEMVCAKYRNTAHITRIYQSSDPAQPKVFHGNTCAHDMNVVSTASVLPRTPADVNGMLSVVFIGPGKFKPEYLGLMFKIRKQKVWEFLIWLKQNNRLYRDMPLDETIMNLYPDDGTLPHIEDGVVENIELDVKKVFSEETAGFSEHPAQLLQESSSDSPPTVLLEKMGVSDPESVKLAGRTFTSSALKNLLPSSSEYPDLVLHRSSSAVPEYNNPNLLPGMFPTLFPLGLAGSDDPKRVTKLSFEAQANAFLDLPDRCFRYHYSYMFVVLNIIQRRTAHLKTHFTVRKSNFDVVANKLAAVSPSVLQSLADHLEREGKLGTLNKEEQDAMQLLRQVNTISARIPGSQASKIFVRNEIRSYFSEFGLPHIYFTFNPSVTHSPIFQVMFGDQSIDLTDRFPFLVPSSERAQRLAKDPVAAADFFDFCVSCVFEHLFGWDYKARKSSSRGGILGHLRAFYGTSEYTERGSLHAHFLIWLIGGCNPNEIHHRFKEEPGFEKRFFDYFEDIIWHHLPDVDVEIDSNYEPRIERPPVPPSTSDISPHALKEWHSFMESEVKKLGEALQRHVCKPVCHKYGNDDKCRFLFPHDIEPHSYFDSDTNSVVLKCLDSMVNYFNRYILVYCRHNHDIKYILSGKAAKAAMFYISDYITKMDVKTYEMLSLLSRAVSAMPAACDSPAKDRAKLLLHKCLAQFSKQQQIHAQQAARYLRGHQDSISSHDTTPMVSGLLLDFLRMQHQLNDDFVEDILEDDIEHSTLKIQTDPTGKLISKNQVLDYLYRSDDLADMNFYQFARCVALETMTRSGGALKTDARLGTLKRHLLKDEHPLSETHVLVEHTNDQRGDGSAPLVPRVVGTSIPREKTGKQWQLFALAHLKPFSNCVPFIEAGRTLEYTFKKFPFSPRSREIMNNWESVHECQDERDAERLRKRAALTAQSLVMTKSLNKVLNLPDSEEVDVPPKINQSASAEFKILNTIRILEQSNWLTSTSSLTSASTSDESVHPPEPVQGKIPEPSTHTLKLWMQDIKQQESLITHARRNAQESVPETLNVVAETEQGPMIHTVDHTETGSCPPTDTMKVDKPDEMLSAEDVIRKVGNELNLNEKQWVAFKIIARSFIREHVEGIKSDSEPLRMLMTGPGGTGKTHVVKAVQQVMEHYGCAHKIRFLAPTGSAATLIDGMTIHKGLGIKIKSKEKGKGNRKLGNSIEDYTVVISIQNRTQLRDEWRDVVILLVDECSLVSCELLSELDSALRFAKERGDEWFGGITVIFAGDFYQYPPVAGTALYTPISAYSNQSNEEIRKQLGRMAWKTVNSVVSLTEQERMKGDPEYGAAVQRLRIRECTFEDVELFNSRVIKSATKEDGVDMGEPCHFAAAAIV